MKEIENFIKKVKVRKDWVLLEFEKYNGEEYKTKEGISIPTNKIFKEFAKVVKVGPGRYNNKGVFIENQLKPGDTVYLTNPARCDFISPINGRYFAFCPEPLIDAVVEESDDNN